MKSDTKLPPHSEIKLPIKRKPTSDSYFNAEQPFRFPLKQKQKSLSKLESESDSDLESELKSDSDLESESRSESESESDISDVELPFEGKIKRLHQMIDDLNETEHKVHNIHLVSSPEIAHALAKRMVRTLEQYIKLHRNVIGPIKNEKMLVA